MRLPQSPLTTFESDTSEVRRSLISLFFNRTFKAKIRPSTRNNLLPASEGPYSQGIKIKINNNILGFWVFAIYDYILNFSTIYISCGENIVNFKINSQIWKLHMTECYIKLLGYFNLHAIYTKSTKLEWNFICKLKKYD